MTLNEYFKNPRRFKNKIIVFSVRDEAGRYISKFTSAFALGLNMKIKFRASYVAVVDMKRDFVYEHTSSSKIECSYKVKNKYIDILSAGFDSGNLSSIKIGEREYSANMTGLNVAVFKSRSLRPVDSFVADSFLDAGLGIKRV
jgi:hypothetical protein